MKKLFNQSKPTKTDIVATVILFILIIAYILNGNDLFSFSFKPVSTGIGYMAVPCNGGYYAIDSGKGRVLKVKGDALEFQIAGVGGDDCFYQAENICVNPDDNSFYVQSVDWDSSGYLLGSERILHYSSAGRYLETVVEFDYEPSDEVNKHKMFDIRYSGGNLRFIYADEHFVSQYELRNGEAVNIVSYPYDRALTMLQNFTQAEDGKFFAIDKHGKIIEFSNGTVKTVYESSDGSSEVMYYLTAAGSDPSLYFVDLYNFQIRKVVGNNVSEEIVSSSKLLGYEPEQYYGQLFTVEYCGTSEQNRAHFTAMADGCIVEFDDAGNVFYCKDNFVLGKKLLAVNIVKLIIIAAGLISIVFLVIRLVFVYIANKNELSAIVKLEITLVLSAVVLTIGIIQSMSVSFKQNYVNNIAQNIKVLALVGSNEFSDKWIQDTNSTADYMSPSYSQMSDFLYKLTTKNHDYTNRYGAEVDIIEPDGRCYAIIYPDNSIGTYFPLDASMAAEIQDIYDTKEPAYSLSVLNAGGNFIFGRSPIFNEEGEVIAVLSVAQDSYKVNEIWDNVIKQLLISLVLVMVVVMLLINEFFAYALERRKFKSKNIEDHTFISGNKVPVQLLRSCAFCTYFVLNMTTSFLSVYTTSFWNEDMGISQPLAGAVPLFANGIFVAVSALLCPKIQSRIGFKNLAFIGVVCSMSGDLLAGLSQNYGSIVLALLLNGLGFGILINSVGIVVGTIDKEEKRQSGFANYNAGIVSGINCGTVAGSMLAGQVEYHQVFYVTSMLWALQIFFFLYLGKFLAKKQQDKDIWTIHRRGRLSRQGFFYLLIVCLPYAIMGGFLYYYIPLFTNGLGYDEKYASILLIIYAVCGISLAGPLTSFMWKKFEKKSIMIAVLMALAAWIFIARCTNITDVGLGLFVLGVSFSFGLNVLVEGFLKAKGMEKIPEDSAMSAYNFTSNMGQSVSPLVCGLLVTAGMFKGMWIFTAVIVVGGVFYILLLNGGEREEKKQNE